MSIEMKVEGALVSPIVTQDNHAWKVEYSNSYSYCQLVNVEVRALYIRGKDPCEKFFRFNFRIERPPSGDSDGDCIPDDYEKPIENGGIGTDPNMKTLFIRPMLKNTTTEEYEPWYEIINPAAGEEFNKSAFADAGIEVVIIGEISYPKFPVDFDPSSVSFPCDILKIKARPKEVGEHCDWVNINFGHTWFHKTDKVWSWDTKGYVQWKPSWYWEEHGYYTPEIYLYAIDRYLKDGAYSGIFKYKEGDVLYPPQDCVSDLDVEGCWTFTVGHSPMNADSDGYADPDPDKRTVRFNQMVFLGAADKAKIVTDPVFDDDDYDFNQVRDRVLTHEIAHAVIGKSPYLDLQGHCNIADCIMFGNITDHWNMDFFLDDCWNLIREGIHNSFHSP